MRVVAATTAVLSFGGRPRRAGGAADTGAGPKAVNREDILSRRYRDRDLAKFESSRRYRER